jgi:hypothetical protein
VTVLKSNISHTSASKMYILINNRFSDPDQITSRVLTGALALYAPDLTLCAEPVLISATIFPEKQISRQRH